MQAVLLVWAALITYVHSICTGALYWDPFNNACVNCISSITKNVHGNLPFFTTPTRQPISAFKPVPPLIANMPTISHKVA